MSEHRVSRNLAVVALASAVAMTTASAFGSFKGNFYVPPSTMSQTVAQTGNHYVAGDSIAGIYDFGATLQGGPEADRSWAAAVNGNWTDAARWNPAGVPVAADNLTFGQAGTYTVALGTALGNSAKVRTGTVTWNGGTATLSSTASVGVTGGTTANMSLIVGPAAASATPATLNITGGAVVNYNQAYVSEIAGTTAILNVTGANTKLTTSTANQTNGRFGVNEGNGTINISGGAEVQARLFEFGRQPNSTSTINLDNGKLTAIDSVDGNPAVLADGQLILARGGDGILPTSATATLTAINNSTINLLTSGEDEGNLFISGNKGTTGTLNLRTGSTITGRQLGMALDPTTNSTFNLETGGMGTFETMFTGDSTSVGNANSTVNVGGTNSRLRVNQVAVLTGGGNATNQGTTTMNVTAGGTLSLGRLNSNQDGGVENNLSGSLVNINVNGAGALFEVKDGTSDVLSSYIAMGFGAWSTDNINVTNGGDVVVTDTGTTEDDVAFVSLTNSSHTRSTVTVDGAGSTFTVDDEFDMGGVGQDSLTGLYGEDAVGVVNIRNGGNLTVTAGNSFNSVDPGNTSTYNIESGGSFVVNGQLTLGGGNNDGFEGVGSGNTNLNVTSGGTATASMILIHQDDGDASLPVAQTAITVTGTNSKLEVNGVDDPFTEGLDGGFIAGGGTFSNTTVMVSAGGQIKAHYFANFGEAADSTTSVTVTGNGSVLDAGGQFALGGVNNNTSTLTVADGGVVKAVLVDEEDIDLLGTFFLGTEAGTGSTVTVNLNNSLGGPNPPQSALDANGVIWVGGTFGGDPAELTLGVPTTITGQANTQLRYGIELYLAPNSTITTAGTFQYTGLLSDGGGTFFDGPAMITGAGVSHMGILGIDNTDATFNGKLTLDAATGHAVVAVSRVDLSGGGKIDLRRSDALVIHPTAFGTEPDIVPAQTLADIKPYIIAGFAGGTWNPADATDAIYGGDIAGQNPKRGIGYRVATAAGDFLGETVAVGDILVRNTLLGDATLDGTVNFNDLLSVAQNYLTANPNNREWFNGNFNYDNAVNFDDLLVTAQNYNGVLTLDGSITGGWGMNDAFMADWSYALSLVPEPTTLSALAGIGLLALRRRKH